jgi:hypothetical protein
VALPLLLGLACGGEDEARVTPPPGSGPGPLGGLSSGGSPTTPPPGGGSTTVTGRVCVQATIVAPASTAACTAPGSTTLRARLLGGGAQPTPLDGTGSFSLPFGATQTAYVLIDGDNAQFVPAVALVVAAGRPVATTVQVPVVRRTYFEDLTQTSAAPPAPGSGSVVVTVVQSQGTPLAGAAAGSFSQGTIADYADAGGGTQLDANGVTGASGTLLLLQGATPNLGFSISGVSGAAAALAPVANDVPLVADAITFVTVTLIAQN